MCFALILGYYKKSATHYSSRRLHAYHPSNAHLQNMIDGFIYATDSLTVR